MVHGLGACDYIDGCSVECYNLHLRLREHPCFASYLNGHPYLCKSMEMLGEICDSNLDQQCALRVAVGSLDDEWGDYVTFIGSVPGFQPMARIGILNGVPYAKYHEYQCDLGTTKLAYGAASSNYEVPISTRNQLFAKASLYLNSEGDDGRHVFGFAANEPTEDFLVPHTLKMVQANGLDSDVIYGVATGSCIGSMHVSAKTATFSLCGYRKSTGSEWEIHSWTGDIEGNMEVDMTMSAFDPGMSTYYFYAWGGPADPQDYLVETNVNDGSTVKYQVPDELAGIVESLVHDHSFYESRLYSSRIQHGTNVMYAIERNPVRGQPLQYIPMAQFSLDEHSQQEFALLCGFEGDLGGSKEEFARFFSLLYEHRWHQHEIRKTTFSKDLPGPGGDDSIRMSLPLEMRARQHVTLNSTNQTRQDAGVPVMSEYMLFADVVGMAISNMYVGPDPAAEDSIAYIRSCHGAHCTKIGSHADEPSTPSIIYLGDFNKLTLENQSLTVQITVDDLDTPLQQLQLHLESSNPMVIRQSDIEELRPANGSSRYDWKERRLLIHPRPGARGMARLTVFVSDGLLTTKSSFVVFVGKNVTQCQNHHDQGCEYMSVSKEVDTSQSRVFLDQEYHDAEQNGIVAGERLRFRVQSVNRFGFDLSQAQDFEPVFSADISSAEHMHTDAEVIFFGERGLYKVTTSELEQAGDWVTHVRGWDGQPVHHSPFHIVVHPTTLDPTKLVFAGPGATSAKQGRPSDFPDGNHLLVTAYDRFDNLRMQGGDRFGVNPVEWKEDEGWNQSSFIATFVDTSEPAVYNMTYWFGDAMYEQQILVCEANGPATVTGQDVCRLAGNTWKASSLVGLPSVPSTFPCVAGQACRTIFVIPKLFYTDNGYDEFEVAESYLYVPNVTGSSDGCPTANPLGPRERWFGAVEGQVSEGGNDNPRSRRLPSASAACIASAACSASATCAPAADSTSCSTDADCDTNAGEKCEGDIGVCWAAEAGLQWSGVYVQSVDEFGTEIHTNDYTASSTIVASTISVTAQMDYISNPQVNYHADGVYNISITFSMAGWRPLFVFAVGEVISGSPFMVWVEPGVLSPSHSYCDGDGIVMATSGTDLTVTEGNFFYINCVDRFDNERTEGNDMFAIDPLEDKNFFLASVSRCDVSKADHQTMLDAGQECSTDNLLPGDRLRVTYWWASSFVQKFEVCPMWDFTDPDAKLTTVPFYEADPIAVTTDYSQTIGAFQNCLSLDNEPEYVRRIDCGSNCYNETRMLGNPLALAMPLEVYMRENQGSAHTSAAHSGLVCLNNILDDTACHMCSGKAGEQSSFTITARNELEFPNFRGGDWFRVEVSPALQMAPVLGCLGTATVSQQDCIASHAITVDASYLRIQFYEIGYIPVVAGPYEMSVTMYDSDTRQWVPVGTSIEWEGSCSLLGSTVAVVVKPGNAYPAYTTYTLNTPIVCGDTAPVVVTVMDAYNNSVTPDVLVETQARINVRASTAGVRSEFVGAYRGMVLPGNVYGDGTAGIDGKGEFVSMVSMELMGAYTFSVMVQTPCQENCAGLAWDDVHVHASPTSVTLLAAPFSPVHTNITNYIDSTTAASALSFALQTQDEYGNTVPMPGLTVTLDWVSSGAVGGMYPVETQAVSDLGGGAYRLDFSAEKSGAYTFRISVLSSTMTAPVSLGNPWVPGEFPASEIFDYVVLPGQASRGEASGPGILGAMAGVETTFAITVQDQFGNVRDDLDLLNVLFVEASATDASTPLEHVAVGIAGGVMRPGWSLLSQDPAVAVGQFDGRYVLTLAGRYRLYFFVSGNPLAGRGDWSQFERGLPAIGGVELTVSNSGGTALGAFSVVAGAMNRPSLSFPTGNPASGIVVGRAGLGATYQVQLLDLYENPRLLDDAAISFSIKRSAGASYVLLDPSEIDYLNYVYTVDGLYTVTVQLNTASRYRLFVEVQDAADAIAPVFLPLDVKDDGATRDPFVTCSNDQCYSQMTIQAGFAAVPRCVAGAGDDGIISSLATSAIQSEFPIKLFDPFDNPNTQQGALPAGDANHLTVTVELDGGVNPADGSTTIVPGVVTWDGVGGRYMARYTVIFAGTYQMSITINGHLLRMVGINVIAGDIAVAETTASGVGLLRTEPMSAALDQERETTWTSSLVAVRVRDANRNNVNNLNQFIPLFSVEITDPAAPGVPLPCPLSVSFTNEGNGNLALDYFLSYDVGFDALAGMDESDSGSGGQMCGGLTVDYDTAPYDVAVLFNGQHIVGSPFNVKVGRYKPPDHAAYVTTCSSACASIAPQGEYFRCSQFDNSCSGDPSAHQYVIADASFAAGTTNNVYFQNVYRTGFPGCGVLECEEEVNDYSAEQTDQTTNARADFSAEIVDRNTGSVVDVGPSWFDAAQLANPTNGLYTFQYNVNVAGEYTISITVGGTPIGMGQIDCAFNVTVTPTIADALSTILTGASQATQVEAFSTVTAVASDRYGNVRKQMDTFTMEFNAASSTSGPTPTVNFDQPTSTYTIQYTVHQCDGSAGFMIRCNGVAVRTTDFSVPCSAGAIAAMTEAVSDPNGAGRSDIAVALTLVAGNTELIKLQARDQYGNIKRAGGEAPQFTAQHVEAQGPDGGAPQTLDLSSRIQDNNDGTYYLSFNVRFLGQSTIGVNVNAQSISNSPYYVQVVAAALFPGTTDAQVPDVAEVGTPFSLSISQRDTFRNAVTQAPAGEYTAYLEGDLFASLASDPLRIDLLWTVSGDKLVEVFYRDTTDSVTRVDTIYAGTYSVYMSPGPAVIHSTVIAADNHYSLYADSFQRTQDCVSDQLSIIVIQTVDSYGNNCDEPVVNANLFDGTVQECSDDTQTCGAVGGTMYMATFAYACLDETDAVACVKGAYTISYTVDRTGWKQLDLHFGVDDLLRAPYVILSDTAAEPPLCIADGPGLQTSVTGNPAQFQITARGTAGPRQGAGDNFVVETGGGAQSIGSVGMEYLGGGVYRATLTATSFNHTSATWQYQVSIKLLDNAVPRTLQHIGGSPFTVTMVPDETAAHYSFARPEGPPPAVKGLSTSASGGTAQLRVRGMDAYNNEVYGCVPGFAVRVEFAGAKFASDACALPDGKPGYMQYARNGLVLDDACTAISDIQAAQSACQSAEYVFDYTPQITGSYEVFITFEYVLIQQGGPVCGAAGGGSGCTDNPWPMQVSSAGISAQYSFVSEQATTDAQPAESGDFNITIAGRSMLQYVHVYDQYQNRLTQPACPSGGSDCIQVILYWCQDSTNMTELTAGRTDYYTMATRATEGPSACERPENILDRSHVNSISTTVADTDASGDPIQNGVYVVDSFPTRSGTILLAVNVDEGGEVVPYPLADRLFRQVYNDAAMPAHTEATPSERSVADEDIEFVIRPHDQFDNFVDDDSLEFTIEIDILTDNPGAYVNTTVDYNPTDGTYTGTYKVNTAGSAAMIRLFVLLDNVHTNQDGYGIRLRAATNKPRFCYVLTESRGPQFDRWHDFSTDLLNEDSKVVGQNLTVTVQSMTLLGPRTIAPESVCNETQILMDDISCERLDEFQIETITISRGQRVSVTGFGASCHQTSDCYGEVGTETLCNPDDCSRRGWYDVKWQATISGTYDISVSSLGVVVQQPPRAGENFQPGHDFSEYCPFSVVVYPSAMSAVTSTVSVEALNLGENSHVEIVGRDVYGNRLLENLGESPAMGVRLKTACQAADAFDNRFEAGFTVEYKDDLAEVGTFTSTVKPTYGGPTEVEVYLNMACFEEMTKREAHTLIPHQVDLSVHPSGCNPFAGQLVGGTSYAQIATLGISVVLPNSGDIGGVTQVAVPIHGLCDYYNNWNSSFLCNWKTRTHGGRILQQWRTATVDATADPLQQQANVDFKLYGATHEVRWRVEQRLGDTVLPGAPYEDGTAGAAHYSYMPNRIGNVWGASAQGICMDVVDPSMLDATLPTTCAELAAAQPCATWTQEFASAGFAPGTTVSDICCETCRLVAVEESVANQIKDVQESWQLPGSPEIEMWLVVETPWGAPLNFTVVDDMDRTVVEQVIPYTVLAPFGDGTFYGEILHEWRLNLPTTTKVYCDPAPSTEAITGVASTNPLAVEFSIEVAFEGGDGVFSDRDEDTSYSSVNVRSYFYYPPPVLTDLVPQATVLRGWGQAYAPISGGMPLIIQGTGFNIGDGAQKDKFLCIFSDRDCSLVNGVGQCANSEPRFDHRDCSTNILTGELVCAERTGLFVSRATYVDDGSLYCTCPAVDATGYTSLEISANSQEVALTQLYMVYYGLENITAPYISAIGGGREVDLTLIDGPSTLDGWCRFGDFINNEGGVGIPVVDSNGAVLTPATRIDAVTLRCTTPDAAAYSGIVPNDYTGVCISFDLGETWSEPTFMIYYTQPPIFQLRPPLTITQGGTTLKIELRAGSVHSDPDRGFTAYDFTPFSTALVPTCLFKGNRARRTPEAKLNGEGDRELGSFHLTPKEWARSDGRTITYLAQEIWCITPSNPNPGTDMYVEISLDNGTSYNYEDFSQGGDPPPLKYYAETSIITESTATETQAGYLSAPAFRMRASENSGTVEVRFQYSCGYSPQYEYLIRCKYGISDANGVVDSSPEVIVGIVSNTLTLGADTINSVLCEVPAQPTPTRKDVSIALNGVDFTGVTTDTIYVWFGQAIAIRGGFVRSMTDSDRQTHFTARADFLTSIDTVVVEIIDRAGNYVSEDAIYQSAAVYLDLQLIAGGGNRTTVYNSVENLERGATFFVGMAVQKPRVGNYEAVIGVTGLDVFILPVTIIQGLGNITNCVVSDTLRKELNVTMGMPLVFHINSRDSADNARIEGGELFRVRVTFIDAWGATADLQGQYGSYMSAVEAILPVRPEGLTIHEWPICGVDFDTSSGVDVQITALCSGLTSRASQYGSLPPAEHVRENILGCCYGFDSAKVPVRVLAASGDHRELRSDSNFVDLDNGKYRGEVILTSQQQPNGTLVPLWGRYRIDIEGYIPAEGAFRPILDSPVFGEVHHVDCAMGGFLRGSRLNEFGDQCECEQGYMEKESGQEEAQGSLVHVVCESCPTGMFGPLPTAPIWQGLQALVPPGTGQHDFGMGVTVEGKYDILSRQGNLKTRTSYNHNLSPGDHRCIPCPTNQHTLDENAYAVEQCICKEAFYDHTKYEIKCMEKGNAWIMFSDGVVLNKVQGRRLAELPGNRPKYFYSATGAPHIRDYPDDWVEPGPLGLGFPGTMWPTISEINDDTRCLPCAYTTGGGSKEFDCFTCFGNDTIAIRPGWWAFDDTDEYDATIQQTKNQLESETCSYGDDGSFDQETGVLTHGTYTRPEDRFGRWPDGYGDTFATKATGPYKKGCLTWERAKSSSYWSEGTCFECSGPEKIPLTAYKCPSCHDVKDTRWKDQMWFYGERDERYNVPNEVPHCTCTGGLVVHPVEGFQPAIGPKGCKLGNAGGVTCGACETGPGDNVWKRGPDGACIPCPLELLSFDPTNMLFGAVGTGVAMWCVIRAVGLLRQADLLLLKIFMSFGQCVQSFSMTYTITWPPELAALYAMFKPFNVDFFEFGGIDCLFPTAKSFYLKFVTTVLMAPGFIGLLVLHAINAMRKQRKKRGQQAQMSMLEKKIESAELLGNYMSKLFFFLILIYLKVSTLVLQMFATNGFEPTPFWDQRLSLNPERAGMTDEQVPVLTGDNTVIEDREYAVSDWELSDRCYLDQDVRLSCSANTYTKLYYPLAWAMVAAYPVGIPGMFLWLLFRDRDQIHDAIQKMKFGFLFADYVPKYFFWEVWDLFRKLFISSLMVFFKPGSVTQCLVATIFSLFALCLHVRIFPYIFQAANLCQLLALNCILLSLFGALLIKVKKDPTQQENASMFVDVFLVGINFCVPTIILMTILIRMALSLYMRSIGKHTNAMMGHTARIAMHGLLLNQAKKRGDKEGGWFGRCKKKFVEKCWQTADIDVLLLADEALALRTRKVQRDRADIALMGAKVELAEMREWLRFVKNNSSNQKEFNEIIQNESMDTYKRRILGAEAVDAEKEFWDSFYGVQDSTEKAAFENAAYRRRYTDAQAMKDLEKQEGVTHNLDDYKIQKKEDRAQIQDIHDEKHTLEGGKMDEGGTRGGERGPGEKIDSSNATNLGNASGHAKKTQEQKDKKNKYRAKSSLLGVNTRRGGTKAGDVRQAMSREDMNAEEYEEYVVSGKFDKDYELMTLSKIGHM